MSNTISELDDLIDSRDVIARIEELENERQTLVDAIESAKEDLADATDDTSVLKDGEEVEDLKEVLSDAENSLVVWDDSDEAEELKVLKALAEEARYSLDWAYGETLIRDSYFEEYAQELTEDCGMINGSGWPNTCIDWEQAARELQMDYTQVEFDNVTYWIHS